MKLNSVLFILIISISCSGSKHKTEIDKTYTKIISQKFKNTDSLEIEIIYKQLSGCVDLNYGRIYITQRNKKMFFYHSSTNEASETEHFSGSINGLIDLVIAFESEAKESNSGCGGYADGTAYEIDLKINNEETKFGFCKEVYDGLNKLVNQIKILKQIN
ncbi:hypothetical protein [Mangrovimonas sp. YM274]|uniref:hypothetical protein n=1 Tax=Mangrovimonas sp. YM274 TaxID=3070660 RepID=UPI0027DC1B77|nr:hypothetical protein [Mangrovimonas sp. YM274]WMI70283.1 hypothetical protein RBH95_07990 [Mangrovimonas sp. YM274]